MMLSSTGPLVMTVNYMWIDVGKWFVLELIFVLGITSALYPLVSSKYATPTGVYPDACDLLRMPHRGPNPHQRPIRC